MVTAASAGKTWDVASQTSRAGSGGRALLSHPSLPVSRPGMGWDGANLVRDVTDGPLRSPAGFLLSAEGFLTPGSAEAASSHQLP